MSAVWRRLAQLATGEAGQGTAWVLAGAALLAAFLATAGPREVTSASTVALHRELAGLDTAATGLTVTGQWLTTPRSSDQQLTVADMGEFSGRVAGLMRAPLSSPPAGRWSGITTSLAAVRNPAPSAVLSLPPSMEVGLRTHLAAHVRVISGRLPGRPGATSQAAGGGRSVQIAVTSATAARFGLHPGSAVRVATALRLLVTGVVVPSDPSGPFWTTDPLLAAPDMEGSMGTATWVGGALTGPGQAPALQGAFSGQTIDGAWFFPLDMHAITLATLPDLLSGIARLATSNLPAVVGPRFADGQRFAFQAPPVLSSSLAGNLSAFLAEQHSASAVDSLIDVGLLAAGVILLLICAGLAADAYRPELSLLRVRGGSARQVGLRVLGRACLVAAPGAAAGGLAGLLAVPAADTALPWLPAAAVAVTAIGATTAVAAWQHRRVRPPADTERDEVSVPRRSPRRAVAEVTVIVLAAGALATLHLAGAQSGTYTSGSPVLAALAASLLAARLYPLPVRSLLRVAAARPGPVGFLGLAGAARARRGAVLPALALVLSLTLAAFAAMVAGSVGAGQNTASWQRIGADAALQAAGNNAISMQAQRALAGVPGVTSVTAVFTSPDGGPFAGQLSSGTGTSRTVGLAVVDPGPYAALAGHTPWPDFPAGLLARRTQGRRVPVLVSRSLAAKLADPGQTGHAGDAGILELGGIRLPVAFEAVIGSTPAMPSGGSFVVLPQWAAGALPSIAGPDLLLATGESAGSQRFRRTAAVTVPGGHLTVRQQVISDLRNAPAQAAAERVNVLGIWAAGALAVVAILLGLAASARSRARLASRMSALGMATRQARALVLTETIPLLLVGILGMAAAATGLALLIGQALNLAVFTAGSGVLPVRPDPMALLLPAAGSIAVALAVAGTQGAVPRRRDTAAALRQEEAG